MTDKPNLPVSSSKSAFLAKVRQGKAASASTKKEVLAKAIASGNRPRLLFSMDATASREASWNVAKEITGAMFEAVPDDLDVALAYHGAGKLQEMTLFSANPKAFLDKVQAVRCKAGMTALNRILAKATETPGLKALIYVGDCFEESPVEAVHLAEQLKLKGVRCFLFHDTSLQGQGYDTEPASQVFVEIARITGGAVLPFDENSPDVVKGLLEAIAFYAAKGIKALEANAKALPAARLLLNQMNK